VLFSEICTQSVLISCDAATSNGPNENFIGPSSFAFEAHENNNAATAI
jgi:hypothetical protein